jgi:membrane protein DedA with SNARE-associated domain
MSDVPDHLPGVYWTGAELLLNRRHHGGPAMHLGEHELTMILTTYGYWAVPVLVGIESMGIPVPGESMLLGAAVYAGTTHHLHIGLVIASAAAGAILGDNLGYLAGRYGGARLLARFGGRIGLDERRMRLGHYLFETHGGKAVFFGRFVAVLRVWAAFLAGTYAMPWRSFLGYNAAGGLIWATGMGTLAYGFGSSMTHMGGAIGIASAVVFTLVMLGLFLGLRAQEHTLQLRADRAACLPKCAAA